MRTQEITPTMTAHHSLRVVQISDFHLFANPQGQLLGVNTYQALQGVVADIGQNAGPIDLVLATGDISQDGSAQSYEHAQALLQPLQAPVVFLPGNHDDLAVMRSVLAAQMPTVTDRADWRIVALDSHVPGSDEGFLGEDQLALLAQAAQTDRWVLVAMHHNPVPMGSAWLDPMMIANACALLALCETQEQIRGLLWGHVHQEMDTVQVLGPERRTVRLMACPATCLQFGPRSHQFAVDTIEPGYRLLELQPNGQIDSRVQRVPGLNIAPDLSSRGY